MTRVTSTAGDARAADAAGPNRAQRLLVLIGGLPGAGKTRLLSRLLDPSPAGVVGLDSEQVTDRLRDAGISAPYGLLRPAVHAWHRLRVRRAIAGAAPVVVVTDPLTRPRRRRALISAGRRSGREVRVVLLDVPPEAAVRGQERRHRTVSPRSMARHARGWRSFLSELAGDAGERRADGVAVVRRAEADRLELRELLD
jgi:hypothetical protein